MKFTGLILICASSCLALILPALGVVQFPNVQKLNPNPTASGFVESAPNRSPFVSVPAVLPSTTFGTNGPLNSSPIPSEIVPNNKLGIGVWLLLAPVCLIGLAMWTFAPNPSGPKPRFKFNKS